MQIRAFRELLLGQLEGGSQLSHPPRQIPPHLGQSGRTTAATSAGPVSMRSAVAVLRQHEVTDIERLSFGIDLFDRGTRGIERGEVVIELGRTASLKSMFQQHHLRILVARRPAAAFLVVTMEMPINQCVRRIIRQENRCTDRDLDAALRAGAHDLEAFCERYQNVHFLDRGAITLSMIEQHAKDLAAQLGTIPLEGIFIDHAGLIRPERPASAYERASEIAIGIKQLARNLDVAVFCIVQANRAGIRQDGEPVSLEAARDSGCFEENADFVITFGNIVEIPECMPYVKIRLAKNRRGACVPAVLHFDSITLRLTERRDEPSND